MATLLDVNVLVALAWPNHVHHAAATSWFERDHSLGWATCPTTESGFVRVSSNRAAIPTATTPAAAIEVLVQLRAVAGHEFWTDDVSFATSDEVPRARVGSYRQVTDAHLVALARRRGGVLATFDRGVPDLLARSFRKAVMLLDLTPAE